jgi:hypothetical protein
MQHEGDWHLGSKLVDCSPAAFKLTVIINNDYAASSYIGVQRFETDFRGIVPVSIQPKQRDGADLFGRRWNRILKPTDMIAQQPLRIMH